MDAIIIFGLPALFLLLCVNSIIRIVISKRKKIVVKKVLIVKAIIFGIIFILIIIFYAYVLYLISRAVRTNQFM